MEIPPVSSDTTNVRASETSDKPMAARCRVPNSLEIPVFSVSGR